MRPSNCRQILPALFAATLLLAACGDSETPADESSAGTSQTDTAESAGASRPADTPESGAGPAADLFGSLALPAPGAEGWAAAQRTYLEAYATQAGVERTESGVYYTVLEKGEGLQPAPGQTVRVHYEGRLVTGKIFDSSYQRGEPAEFTTTQVIQGWQDILPQMREGATWQVAIPAELAYGSRAVGNGLIPPDSALVFTIELLQVKG